MRRSNFDANAHIAELNNVKKALQATERPFSKRTILDSLKGCKLPYNSKFWRIFRDSGLVQETSRGMFMFTSKEPINIHALEKVYKNYQLSLRRYNEKAKKPKVETQEVTPEENPEAMIQFAIDLLKEKGYQIFAPVGVIYQQL